MKKIDKSDCKVKPIKPSTSCGKGTMKKIDKSDCKVKPIKLEDLEELLEGMFPPFTVKGDRGASFQKTTGSQQGPKEAGGAFPLYKYCRFCGAEGDHLDHECSYLKFVPPGAKLGPDYTVACQCHDLLGGHPDRNDWKGYLIRRLDDEFVEHDTYCNKLEGPSLRF
ncbi:hypothetical protein M0R45_036132 [Rubus argutus]|uniref:Uncharacterized protein n=1 Tax=Rubus argutus TaxID=59490 RepID=A0AAW1VYX8_RUBAR